MMFVISDHCLDNNKNVVSHQGNYMCAILIKPINGLSEPIRAFKAISIHLHLLS